MRFCLLFPSPISAPAQLRTRSFLISSHTKKVVPWVMSYIVAKCHIQFCHFNNCQKSSYVGWKVQTWFKSDRCLILVSSIMEKNLLAANLSFFGNKKARGELPHFKLNTEKSIHRQRRGANFFGWFGGMAGVSFFPVYISVTKHQSFSRQFIKLSPVGNQSIK